MSGVSFDEIWNRIARHAGESFHTKTGLPFMYEIRGNVLYPSRTKYRISRTDFEEAFQWVPIQGPGDINKIVRGPAYIWSILHDPRITLNQW